jgi:Zn-dependent protease with chaperone function
VDLSVLLSLPVESVTIRAVVATIACVSLVRLLLRVGLRSARARIATALAPGAALVTVVLLTGSSLALPVLMVPAATQGADALPIWFNDGYLHFAPIAAPLLVGLWTAIAGGRLLRRSVYSYRARRDAGHAISGGDAPPALIAMTRRLAASLQVPPPTVGVVADCPGGAYVVGTRRPLVVVGRELMERLDDEELEGVLAHELAHVKRHDNLVSTALGILRDLTFFVPGGGWAIRQLHRERELAADQVAIRATRRPGALASGLLKVLEGAPDRGHACAALAPSGSLVDRVRVLIDDAPQPSRLRSGSESVAVIAVVVGATTAALVVPGLVAGAERQRDAVALMWAGPAGEVTPTEQAEARVFDVYRRSSLEVGAPSVTMHAQLDEHSQENRRGVIRACAVEEGECPVPSRRIGLGLRPQVTIVVDDALTSVWSRATPVTTRGDSSGAFGLYWLTRME